MANVPISQSVYSGNDYAYQTADDGDVYTVLVGVTLSADFSAVEIGNASNVVFKNLGTIHGTAEDGVVMDAEHNSFVNGSIGSVVGGDNGVSVASANNAVTNSGGITGGFAGILASGDVFKLNNTGGLIYGGFAGLYSDAQHATITNAGTIFSANIGVDLAVDFTSITITNTGTIHGSKQAIASTSNGGALTVTNTGKIEGALGLGAENDTITNKGSIAGSVTLGDGTNRYDGRSGTITGPVTGGGGVDTILAGNDGETIGGGLGHDVLYGGAGADTFVFASAHTADRDTIRQFDVGADHIGLVASRFIGLTAGATPVFSTGTKASGAADHLFYNSATGGLFYDRDGTGTTYAAVQFATLDKGLHLTASNFLVT